MLGPGADLQNEEGEKPHSTALEGVLVEWVRSVNSNIQKNQNPQSGQRGFGVRSILHFLWLC
jgi:hypothetical protein